MKKTVFALGLTATYLASTLFRHRLAKQALAEPAPAERVPGQLTVMQPIVSGDDLLEAILEKNLLDNPDLKFIWLVDEDDLVALEMATRLAKEHAEQVGVVLCGNRVLDGRNPKTVKLAKGLPHCSELVLVMDDDVELLPGTVEQLRHWLSEGEIVSGVQCYRPGRGFWAKLVSSWVNSSLLFNQLPSSQLSDARMIHGALYLTRKADLEQIGGYESIWQRFSDDFALAKAYLKFGKRIVTAPIPIPMSTTVEDGPHYYRLMRRWNRHARKILQAADDPRLIAFIVVPHVLPAVGLSAALLGRSGKLFLLTVGALAVKAGLNAKLRFQVPQLADADWRDSLAEVLSDILSPYHFCLSGLPSKRVEWRGAHIDTIA